MFDVDEGIEISAGGRADKKTTIEMVGKELAEFAKDVMAVLHLMYEDAKKFSKDSTYFGKWSLKPVVKKTLSSSSFARDPWSIGSCPPGPAITVTRTIEAWWTAAPVSTLSR